MYVCFSFQSFYRGLAPKMVESFFKGGALMFSKEAIIRGCKDAGIGTTTAGLIGGFGGGVAQVVIIGPCTFLVTAAVTGDKSIGLMSRIGQTWKAQGIGGFYAGGVPLMFRQGTNWASRQGFTDYFRNLIKEYKFKDSDAANIAAVKLTVAEESLSAICGGALSTWNQPFEVGVLLETRPNQTRPFLCSLP